MNFNVLSKNNQYLKLTKKYFCDAKVTPWTVEGQVDYTRLVSQFGTEIIDTDLINKFEKVTGHPVHPWIRRGIFFSHRGLNNFLDAYERGDPVFLYTGRGPSSDAMHLGHLIPFMFTKWLQDTLNCPLVIQISDEEKSAFKNKNFNEIYKLGFDNAKDIISCGFDKNKTFIFSNRDYRLNCKNFELLATEMKNLTSAKEIKKIFGFNDDASILMYDWPFYQTAAAYSGAYPHIFNNTPAYCLVPHAIDQDPYFRLARDLSPRLSLLKPHNIMSKFIPSLSGGSGKMSSSQGQEHTIFLNDSISTIKNKILRHSYSGGGGDGSLADHKKYGGNPEIDIAYQYLKYFEEDDEKLERIRVSFVKGELTCGELKNILLEKLIIIISDIQEKKSKVDDSLVNEFYTHKPILINKKNKHTRITETEAQVNTIFEGLGIKYFTKYHQDSNTIIDKNEFKISLGGHLCKTLLLKGSDKDYYMLIINDETIVNIKNLKKKLNLSRLNFAERDTVNFLFNYNENNFSLSPLSLVSYMYNQKQNYSNLQILIEEGLSKSDCLNLPLCRNDATTRIPFKDLSRFINKFGYELKPISLD